MPTPNVLVLRAPGTNCDHETAFAFEKAGAVARRTHINELLENSAITRDFQILCAPEDSAMATISPPAASWETRSAITWETSCTNSKRPEN